VAVGKRRSARGNIYAKIAVTLNRISPGTASIPPCQRWDASEKVDKCGEARLIGWRLSFSEEDSTMTIEHDLSRIALQEETLRFDAFDLSTAWVLGKLLYDLATERNLGVAIDVTIHSTPAFYAALAGSTPDNAYWVRRKRNMVLRYFRSSYALGLALEKAGKTIESDGLSPADFASHGGSFPIYVNGTGCVGAVTVSGLPQRDDHNLVVEALALMLGHELYNLGLSDR
jgi:uncharacterized protein (UPF0303 family)